MAGRIAYYGNIVKDGLILDLDAAKLDSYPRTGTAWRDISGFGNNGTLVNGPTFNSGNGGSIVFDGVNDRVTSPAINVTNWTVQVWVKSAPVVGNYKGIFEFAFTSSGRSGLGINIDGKPLIAYPISAFRVSTGAAIDNNIWYHLVGTLNSGVPNLYLNGISQTLGSVIGAAPASTLNTIFIGDFSIASYPLNGNVGIVQFYNRALSATEILQNFNATRGRYGI